MKKIYLTSSLIVLTMGVSSFAQNGEIMNGGFENWSDVNLYEKTSDWDCSNDLFWVGQETTVKSTDAHDGNYSAQLKTISLGSDTTSGFVFHGVIGPGGPESGIPYTSSFDEIKFRYKSDLAVGDSAYIMVIRFLSGNLVDMDYQAIAYGSQNSWTQGSINVGTGTQDEVFIGFLGSDLVNDNNNAPGGSVHIDAVEIINSGTAATNVPDASFENWEFASYQEADDWYTFNSLLAGSGTYNAAKTTDANSGMYAMQLETIQDPESGDTIAAYMSMGVIDINTSDVFTKLPYSATPSSFTGSYKYSASNGDQGFLTMIFYSNGNPVGTHTETFTDNSSFTSINASLTITSTPDSILFVAYSGENPGSVLILDDLSFMGGDVSVYENKLNVTMYPNPAHDIFYITGEEPFTYNILDLNGRVLLTDNFMDYTKSVNISDLPNGNYIVSINDGKLISTKKLVVLR